MLASFLTSWFQSASARPKERGAEYEDVMRAHGPALLRVARVYGFSDADREEVEQDIAVAIWESLPGWNSNSSLRTYLFRVAHNTSIDRLRRKSRQLRPDESVQTDHQSSPDPSPESQAIDRDHLRHLERAVQDLPLLQRQVIALSMEGISTEEIAQILGITGNYVHVILHRTRAALKAKLEAV